MCDDHSVCSFTDNTVQKGGVVVRHAQAAIRGGVIEDGSQTGLSVTFSTASASGLTVQRTQGPGVYVGNGGSLDASNLTVRDTAGDGVAVNNTANVTLSSSTIANNQAAGVHAHVGGTILFLGATITGNQTGVYVGDIAAADFFGGATVTGNTSLDIACGSNGVVVNTGFSVITPTVFGTTNCNIPTPTPNAGK